MLVGYFQFEYYCAFLNFINIKSTLSAHEFLMHNQQNPLHRSSSMYRRCSVKKVFLEISQNSQENICVRVSFLIKLPAAGRRPVTLSKKRLGHRCVPVNFAKFLRAPFLTKHLWWLLFSVIESFLKNRHRFFRLSDKWYVKQMKLFNFMNCRASWTPDKLHGSLHPPPN